MKNSERESFLQNGSRKYNNITTHDIFHSDKASDNIPWTFKLKQGKLVEDSDIGPENSKMAVIEM